MAAGAAMSRGATEWSEKVRLRQIAQGPLTRRLVADETARSAIARDLGLDRLDELEGEMTVSPWLDGAEIRGRWRARIVQTCGVTLEPLPSEPEGEFLVRAVPAGSPNAPAPSDEEELIDLEADDPPDVLDADEIDLAAYLVEQLALQIDPFPRKPGAVFEQPDEPAPPSPFESLRNFHAGPKRS
jgi:hypothetical protein